MKDLPENELLSAYLDGELTAKEQAQVEQLLSKSSEARQLLDELRALSSALQALPQYTLGEDIHQRVLQLAEKEMAVDHPTPKIADRPPDAAAGFSIRRFLSPRAVFWSTTAVAVAVIVTIFNPQVKDDRLAMKPEEQGIDATRAVPSIGAAPEEADAEESDDLGTFATRPAPMDKDSGSFRYGGKRGSKLGGEGGGGFGYAKSAEKSSATHEATPSGVTGSIMRKGTVDINGRSRGVVSNATGQTFSLNGAKNGGDSGIIVSNGDLRNGLLAQDKAAALAGADANVAVIQCAMSREAMNSGALRKALRANGVTLGETYTTQRSLPSTQGKAEGRYEQDADGEQHGDSDLEVLVVEANAEQIKATLLAMAKQPQAFYSVSVEPARNVKEQQSWRGYASRGLHRQDAASSTGDNVAADAPAPILRSEDQSGGDHRLETPKKAVGKLVPGHAEPADGSQRIPAEKPKAQAPAAQAPAAKTPSSGRGLGPGGAITYDTNGDDSQVQPPAEEPPKVPEKSATQPAAPTLTVPDAKPPTPGKRVAPTTDETQGAPETDGPSVARDGRESRRRSEAVPSDEAPGGDSRQQPDAEPALEIQPAESESASPVVEERDSQRGQLLEEESEEASPGEDRAKQREAAGVEEETVRPAGPTQVDDNVRMDQIAGGQQGQPLPTYRVLFIVRLVDANVPPAAASIAIKDEMTTERAAKEAAKAAIDAKQPSIDANAK